jgi:integrase
MKVHETHQKRFEFPWGYQTSNQTPEGLSADPGVSSFKTSSSKKVRQKCQSRTQVGHFISVAETAHLAGVTAKTILRWCQSGELAAMPKAYGSKTTYLIHQPSLLHVLQNGLLPGKTESPQLELPTEYQESRDYLKEQTLRLQKSRKQPAKQPSPQIKPHSEYVELWFEATNSGTIPKTKRCRPKIAAEYRRHIENHLKVHKSVSIESFKKAISNTLPEQYATRRMLYRAIVNFAKVLVEQQVLEASFLDRIKDYKPEDNPSPKREVSTEDDYKALLDACESPQDKFMVILMYKMGLRASEACALKRDDVFFPEGYLIVRKGKGGKSRRLPMPKTVKRALKDHYLELPKHQKKSYLFWNRHGEPMNRHGVDKRLKRLAERAGIAKRSAHTLRRGFGTHNAKQGRALRYIQQAYGHSSIKTTEIYLQISEQDLLDEMKHWD